MTKPVLPLAILAALAFAVCWFASAGAAPAPEARGPLAGELKVDGKYGFIIGNGPAAEQGAWGNGQATERGYFGKVLAIDASWVKIESYRLTATGKQDPPYQEEKVEALWLNLTQVTAIVDRPPSSVLPRETIILPRPGLGDGGRGGPGGGRRRVDPQPFGNGGRGGGPGLPGGVPGGPGGDGAEGR